MKESYYFRSDYILGKYEYNLVLSKGGFDKLHNTNIFARFKVEWKKI